MGGGEIRSRGLPVAALIRAGSVVGAGISWRGEVNSGGGFGEFDAIAVDCGAGAPRLGIRSLSVRFASLESVLGSDGLGDISLSKGQKAFEGTDSVAAILIGGARSALRSWYR